MAAAVSPLVSPVAGLPILQSGSLELIKYHWRGKAGPAFFPGSHCVLLSLGCHHTGAQSPPRLCGHQWSDNAPMCSPQCAAKKLYITKLGTKAPCDRLCLDPNISAFTINWQGLKRSFSVIICIVKYHHPMSALVSLSNGWSFVAIVVRYLLSKSFEITPNAWPFVVGGLVGLSGNHWQALPCL